MVLDRRRMRQLKPQIGERQQNQNTQAAQSHTTVAPVVSCVRDQQQQAGDHHNHQRNDQSPIEVTARVNTDAVSETMPYHQRTAAEHRQAADIGEHLPGAEEVEGIDELALNEGVDFGGDNPE